MINIKHPIGLFGGTFDPVHLGHIVIANSVAKTFAMPNVHLIPCKEPTHREKPKASNEDRLAMLRLATMHHPKLIVNDIELQRPGPSYTIDTLKTLHALIPTQPLALIIGEDVFAQFNQWLHWHKILDYTHLIVVNRPEHPLPMQPWMQELLTNHQTTDKQLLLSQLAGKIYLFEIPPQPYSATKIRELLNAGKDISGQVSKEVAHYIKQHQLY